MSWRAAEVKAQLFAWLAVLAYFGLGVVAGFVIHAQIDHRVSHRILPIAIPSCLIPFAPLLYLGVRSLVAPGVGFSYTKYSRNRATGSGTVSMSKRAGVVMTSIAVGAFAIGVLLTYVFRNNIG